MNPIVFVHGFGGDEKQYRSLTKFLRKKGITNYHEFCYSSTIGLHPIKEMAREMADYIEKNVKEENITIIAISQGGIIALAYLKYYKNKSVKKLFTICTPHRGSMLAKIFNLPGIIDLRPNSKLLRDLEWFLEESKINVFSVWTPFDLMVFPGWNAKPWRGETKMILAPTHPSAFWWPATKRFIYKNLF